MNNRFKSRRKLSMLGLIVLLFSASNTTMSATISALSDDFESETLALNYAGFSNWSVSNGTVDTVGPTFGTPLINCQGSTVCGP